MFFFTEGLAIRSDGLVLLSDVLIKAKCSREEVTTVVTGSDKQRFAIILIDGKEYIRANQGHSIPVPDLELKRITSIEDIPKSETTSEGIVVHGTYRNAWKSIKKQGLSKMTRNHIHFAVGTPGESHVISGMRSSCQVLVYVDIAAALADGVDFFLSENHVVLSGGNAEGFILPKYFKAVLDADTNKPFDEDFPGTL
jgi:2'-phosphotransferase